MMFNVDATEWLTCGMMVFGGGEDKEGASVSLPAVLALSTDVSPPSLFSAMPALALEAVSSNGRRVMRLALASSARVRRRCRCFAARAATAAGRERQTTMIVATSMDVITTRTMTPPTMTPCMAVACSVQFHSRAIGWVQDILTWIEIHLAVSDGGSSEVRRMKEVSSSTTRCSLYIPHIAADRQLSVGWRRREASEG